MNLRDKCPLCSSADSSAFISCTDFTVSKENFVIVVCDSCRLHYTKNIPPEDKIGEYYKSEDYISHSSTDKGFINKLYQIVRKKSLNNKLKLVSNYIKNGDKLIDVGAGTGHFLKACLDHKIDAKGFEPDETARSNAKKINHVELEHISKFEEEKDISVLTMWHVLEHVYNLTNFIDAVKTNLVKDGIWVIAVPNMLSHDAKHYGKFWAAYDVPRHLYHFTPDNIRWICERHDFTLEDILPMKFDSYYVSLLSEKYKGGNMFKAFWQGLISNYKAKRGTYSSQVYVLKKN